MLTRLLLADNSLETPETIFVVHPQTPRFIVEVDLDDFWNNQIIHRVYLVLFALQRDSQL